MAGKSTIATLKGRTEGFGKVQKDLDNTGKATQRLDRNTTRLGQSSASTGRQFAAQANGLGGIVGSYAAAAANIFAITAAFVALRRAAEFEQIISGTNSLANTIGSSGDQIISTVQKITKSQLSLLDTVQQVNLGLVSGFNATQIANLSDVSLRASKALGRNLADAFTRVTRGAAKLEPELLDELGIFTRIDPAVKTYADSVGKSVTSLTNFERRQAFVNAVIEEGTRKYKDVDVSTNTAAESLQKLAARITDVGLQFGAFIATGLAPVADFISGSLSNTVALFGVLVNTVGGRAITVLTAGIDAITARVTFAAGAVASFLNTSRKAFKAATLSVTEYANAVNLPRFGDQELRREAVAALQAAKANQLLTKSEIDNAKTKLALYRASIQNNIELGKYTKNLQIAQTAVADLSRGENLLAAQSAATSRTGGVLGNSILFLGKGFNFAGRLVSGLISKLFFLTTVLSFVQLGVDAINNLFGLNLSINIFEPIIKSIKDLVAGFRRAGNAARGFAAVFADEIRSAYEIAAEGPEDFDDIDNKIENLSKSLKGLITNATEFQEYINSFGGIDNINPDAFANAALNLKSAIAELQTDPGGIIVLREYLQLAGIDAKDVTSILTGSFAAGEDLDIVLGRIIGKLGDFSKGIIAIQQIADEAGIASRKIFDMVKAQEVFNDRVGISILSTGDLEVRIGRVVTQLTELRDGVIQIKSGFENVAPAVTGLAVAAEEFALQFELGLINAERAAAGVAQQQGFILTLETELGKIRKGNTTLTEDQAEARIAELESIIKAAKIENEINKARSDGLAILEKTGNLIDKIYGKTGEKLDQLQVSGVIDAEGNVALTAREKLLNQTIFLTKQLAKADNVRSVAIAAGLGDELAQRESLTKRIKDLTDEQAAASIKAQTLPEGNLKDFQLDLIAERAEQLVGLRAQLDAINKQIKATNSEGVEILETELVATQALYLLRQDLEKVINKEIEAQRKKSRDILLEELQVREKIIQLQEDKELQALKQRVKLEQQILQFRKNAFNIAGINDEATDLINAISKGKIELEVAEATKAQELARLDRQAKLDEQKLINDKKDKEFQLGLNKAEVNATISLIKQLGMVSDALEKVEDALLGREPSDSIKIGPDFANDLTKSLAQQQTSFENLFGATGQYDDLGQYGALLQQENALKAQLAKDGFDATKQGVILEIAAKNFAASETVRIFKGVNEVITGELKDGINSFFDAIVQGTLTLKSFKEGFKSFLFDVFEGIRKVILEETLIKPITKQATGFLGNLFGLEGLMQQSVDDAVTQVSGGAAVRVTLADPVSNVGGIDETIQALDTVSEKQAQSVNASQGFWASIAQGFRNVGAAANTFFSFLFESVRSLFSATSGSGVFSFLGAGGLNFGQLFGGESNAQMGTLAPWQQAAASSTLSGTAYTNKPGMFASGGLVKRFAGGGNVNYQDRVPALLQPGEFVMKKSAVKAMGAGNMAMMNATGSGGNVVVNINNQGTPQEAQASQPTFDGEKYVIDIVTRDLRNNGPIRKSLRGGAA